MRLSNANRKMLRGARLALLTTSLLVATPALAQLTTATINGHVTNKAVAAPGTVVTARSIETGASAHAVAGPDGGYVLTGLRPGTYDISFGGPAGATITRRVIIQVGQSASLDVDVAAPETGAAEATEPTRTGSNIVVTGRRLVETRTSEVATNITRDQIENLPQSNRNFLNFAALAPGIRMVQDPNGRRQTFAGGGVGTDPNGESTGGPQVNVFIDGVSLRSNVNQGGIVGQDVSAGNPFSQLAVREFRVLTSNFKAEYEDAGTAIITAVTKSGTNEFHGEAFGLYSDQRLIARDYFQVKNNQSKVPLKRYQYGAALGGPIIRNKLFFFANYEANIKDRNVAVTPGPIPDAQGPLIPFNPQSFAGVFVSPFREHLGFGKLTFLPTDNQVIELTGSIRKETDLRDFGGTDARERGTKVNNDVYAAKLSYTYNGRDFLNEATVDYLDSDLKFGGDAGTGFGLIYGGVISTGANPGFQRTEQKGLTFRDDASFTNIHWNGDHLIKIGGKLSFQNYHIVEANNANPQFFFTFDPNRNLNFGIPEVVNFGGGNPDLKSKTTQFGLFVQDDWSVNPHLNINAGVRWDVDTNFRNRGFVTPAKAVAALQALAANPLTQPTFFNVNDYISTGHNRKIDYGNIAPRIGFSYDLNADQRTVFFGGYGRYYDRALFRNAAEESLFTQFQFGQLHFSANGLPLNGQQTVAWNPNFLTESGFAALLASLANNPLAPGTNELRVIRNDLKTPYTDQFSIGIRQRLGIFRASVTFNHTVGKDQIAYAPLNKGPQIASNGFFITIPLINGYGNAVAAFNTRETRFNAIYATLDKPYTKESGWGGGIAYTGVLSSKERGNGAGGGFNFDYPNIAAQPFVPNGGNEKHHLVVNGIADLPLDFRASGLVTYGSGAPYLVIDANQGFQPGRLRIGYFNHLPYFLQVDLRLQKIFRLGGDREFSLSAEVFNLFNRANFGSASSCCTGTGIGQLTGLSGPPRTFQLGASVRF
ncbi:MAG: TonB-dependent receptor domain-containing protein [Sphingomonas sp.]